MFYYYCHYFHHLAFIYPVFFVFFLTVYLNNIQQEGRRRDCSVWSEEAGCFRLRRAGVPVRKSPPTLGCFSSFYLGSDRDPVSPLGTAPV